METTDSLETEADLTMRPSSRSPTKMATGGGLLLFLMLRSLTKGLKGTLGAILTTLRCSPILCIPKEKHVERKIIDGKEQGVEVEDARDVAQPSLRKAVKVVPQDSVVFSASIAYNVSKPGAVTKAARMPERITSFLDGYSRMGERGVGLSGREAACGDRRDAPSVPRLLDEPTSALEAATEKDI
ncbi:uncharacterized protein B0H18DRAFT_1116113 [Fomitopsis serialis]|uniref:uncharacterized protein n=1 Tax=Fomitopsis serialis TaxID=139415 RepID=UPI002008BD40|nr:uncharacterized protein B0H18DRAFT_1116113 [Neoantrodia serialis]KAH9931860.1 hypothetical protein B0H18DRAFT_1116113 [Neoantrodia serialis]